MEFFRFCPGCGRRFHVKLENKELVRLERHENQMPPPPVVAVGRGRSTGGGVRGPVIVDIEEFQYNYKCMRCGHEWSDKRVEEHKEG